jgi:hypothetical protein
MSKSVILIGGPDTGKTNFLARLVHHLQDGKGSLRATKLPDDIQYIENALEHLMKGEFAPRSHNTTGEVSGEIAIDVRYEDQAEEATITLPDVAGETWDEVAKSAEISQAWLDRVINADGALLFVRVLSDLNVVPLDWVAAPQLLVFAGPPQAYGIPTQVMLCDFLRLLEENLGRSKGSSHRPRVAVVLTAYDRLDAEEQVKGPTAFLEDTFPLFGGKIANCDSLEIGVFGASVVGGELAEQKFREGYLGGDLVESGFIIDETRKPAEKVGDMSRPVTWVLNYPTKT